MVELLVKQSGPRPVFVGRSRILIHFPYSLLLSLFTLGIYQFLLGYPIYWHIIIHSNLLILCVSLLSFVMSVLLFLIWAFPLFFFLVILDKSFVYLFYLLKEPLLVFAVLSIFSCGFFFFWYLFHLFILWSTCFLPTANFWLNLFFF